MERKLAAILAADVVGYSRLMGADEEATLRALKALRAELFDPAIAKHNGRIVKLMGDGTLVEFASVVDAVNCAVEVQAALTERNTSIPDNQRLELRIGINLGDVIVEGDDLYGDGINVAARLEGLAEPGGICVSQVVVDQSAGKVPVDFADTGAQQLKNIKAPVQTYRVVAKGEVPRAIPTRSPRRGRMAGVLALIGVAAIGLGYLVWGLLDTKAPTKTALALPDKPSIAVLPFQDLSENNPHEWFGDGMAEDIITDLSKLSGLFVISRNSSFQFRGGSHDLRQVGRQLGVAYLLEGSVRRAGNTLRINAQLIDASTGGHLWAERYDGSASDVFMLQDRVTGNVVKSLELALTLGNTRGIAAPETAPRTSSIAAHDAYLQGLSHLHRRTKEDFSEAKRWIDKALELDPTYAEALGARANLYMEANQRGWHASAGIGGEPDVIAALLVALEYPSALAHATEAEMLILKPDVEGAQQAVERGAALDPNDIDLQLAASRVQSALGNYALAISLVKRAIRLDPLNPGSYQYELGRMKFIAGDLKGALDALDSAHDLHPKDWFIQIVRAPILVELGRLDEAIADMSIAHKNWQESWGTVFTAPSVAWLWGRELGDAYVQRLIRAYVSAGAPAVPDGYDLRSENRLDLQAFQAAYGGKYRTIGKCCGGYEWMHEKMPGGERHFLNGNPNGTSKLIEHADGSFETRFDDPYRQNRFCEIYRNPSGSNDTLDAYLAVCNTGIFPHGMFYFSE